MNINDYLRNLRIKSLAKERALDSICEEEAQKIYYSSDWKKFMEMIGLIAVPTVIAGAIGSFSGLESAINNASAIGLPETILGLGVFGLYKSLSKNERFYNLNALKKQCKTSYQDTLGEKVSFDWNKCISKGVIVGVIGLGLAALAKKVHLTVDYSVNVVYGATLLATTFQHTRNYLKKLKIKKKVDARARGLESEIEQEIRREEEAEKKANEERQNRWTYDAGEDFNFNSKEFEEFFKRFNEKYSQYFKEEPKTNSRSYQRPPVVRQSLSYSQAFSILQIDKNQGYEAARKSYRKLAMQYHPDRNKGSKTAENKFKEISAAWALVEKFYEK